MSSSISRVQNINQQNNSSLQDYDSKTGVINTVTDFGIQQIKQQLRYEITNDLLKKLNNNVNGESIAINANDSSSKKNDSDIATISAINYEIVCLLEIIINNSNSSTLSSICSNIKKRLILQFPNADISSRLSNVNNAPRRKRKRTAAMQTRRFNDNNNEVLVHSVNDTHQYNRKNDEEDEDVLAYSSTNKLRRIDELVNNGDADRNITAAMNKTNNNSNSYQELSFASDQFILNINGLNHNLSNLEKLLTESHNNNNGHDKGNDHNHKIQHRNENGINIANHNNPNSINNSLRVENLISKDSPYFPSNDSSDNNNNAIIASRSNTAVYGTNEVNSSTMCATSNNNSNNIDKISINNILNGHSSLPSLPAYNIDSNRQHTQQNIDKSQQLQQNAKQNNASGQSNNNTLSAAMMIPSIASLIDSIPSISSQNHANGNFGPTNVVVPLTSSMPVSSEITSNSINSFSAGYNNSNSGSATTHDNNNNVLSLTSSIGDGSENSNGTYTSKYISIHELLKRDKDDEDMDSVDEDMLMHSDIDNTNNYTTEDSTRHHEDHIGTITSNDCDDAVVCGRQLDGVDSIATHDLMGTSDMPTCSNNLAISSLAKQSAVSKSNVPNLSHMTTKLRFNGSTEEACSPMYVFIKTDSLETILSEYFYGIGENMSIKQLEQEFGTRWRGGSKHSISKSFNRRKNLYRVADMLLSKFNFQMDKVVEKLESIRRFVNSGGELIETKSVAWLCNNITFDMVNDNSTQ